MEESHIEVDTRRITTMIGKAIKREDQERPKKAKQIITILMRNSVQIKALKGRPLNIGKEAAMEAIDVAAVHHTIIRETALMAVIKKRAAIDTMESITIPATINRRPLSLNQIPLQLLLMITLMRNMKMKLRM